MLCITFSIRLESQRSLSLSLIKVFSFGASISNKCPEGRSEQKFPGCSLPFSAEREVRSIKKLRGASSISPLWQVHLWLRPTYFCNINFNALLPHNIEEADNEAKALSS